MNRSRRQRYRRRRAAVGILAVGLLCAVGFGGWRLAQMQTPPPGQAAAASPSPVQQPVPQPTPAPAVVPPRDPRAGFGPKAALVAAPRVADRDAPPEPLALAATLKPEGSYLTWRSGGGNVDCWQIYRLGEDGTRTPVACVPAGTLNYLDNPKELRPQGVVYEVTAKDAAGRESASSTPTLQASARTLREGWRGNLAVGQRLLRDLTAARPGAAVDIRPFDGDTWTTAAKVEALAGQPARTMIFSDSPETIATPGIAYQSEVSGLARIYYYHVNSLRVGGAAPTAYLGVVLTNKSGQPASYRITRQAGGAPASPNHWEALTRDVTRLWLDDESVALQPDTVTVPPGESRLLDGIVGQTAIGQDQLVHGIYDLEVTGKLQVTVVMAAGDPLAALPTLKPLTPDPGHDRGTFPLSAATLRFELPADGFGRLWLAPGPGLANLTGQDALTGKAVSLAGNYGVEYHLASKAPVAGTLVINPLGGEYAGPVRLPGVAPFQAPGQSIAPFDDVAVIGHYKAGETIAFDWMPPALSSLPVRLLFIPDAP